MAEAKLTVGVGVELEPGPVTREWLIGLGWVPPVSDSDAGVQTEEDDEEDYDPRPIDMFPDVAELVPEPQPLRTGRAMGGAEAMRHRAARLRRDLMNEVSSPERVDEMLRNLDVNVEALPSVDCDC